MVLSSARLLQATIASGDPIDVRHFDVREEMSRLFEVRLTVLSDNPDIDMEAVVGQPASFTIHAGDGENQARVWSGLATALEQIEAEDTGVSTYRLTLAPHLWLLTQRRNYRIFQQRSDVEVARQLLREWSVPFTERLSETYKRRKYRVQYRETDYVFLSRTLEDAGISFFFEVEDGTMRLVLHDAPQTAGRRLPLVFRDQPVDGDLEHITDVRLTRRVRPGRYTVQDHDYRRPPTTRLVSAAKSGLPIEETLERYHYVPGASLFQSEKGDGTPVADDQGKYRVDDGERARLAARRLDAKRATSKVLAFQSNAADVAPGVVFSMLDHPKRELSPDKGFLVTSITWQGSAGGEWKKAGKAVGADTDYRPSLVTRKPRVSGLETATVVGPPGETIHTDEFGRVRVQFHWDREGVMDDRSSCWIPVSHPWAGGGFGVVNLPRVGHEVIIDFLGGDPDRPIVVGRVYTNLQKVPFALPALKTQSGWKSQTIGGTGYNEIMFEDAPGAELVRVQAERDLSKLVKRNESVTIGNDRSATVGHDESWVVGHDRSRVVGNNETVLIGNSQSVTVGVNQSITVGADQTITLPSGNQTETIHGNRTFSLTGDLTETIIGSSTLTQIGDQTETLTGSSTLTQIGDQSETLLGGQSLLQLGGQTVVQAGGRTSLQLGGRLDVQLGGRKDFQLGDRVDIQLGGTTRLEIGKLGDTVIGPRDETTVGDATETVTGTKKTNAPTYELTAGQISVKGGVATVTAGGAVTIKGSIIKLNC